MEIVWSYAVVLALAIALVKFVEGELKAWNVEIPERVWLYARGVVSAAAVGLTSYFTSVPQDVLIIMGIVATFLSVLGYWPEVQELGLRLKGRAGKPLSATWRK